ncbi:hypothetical protein JOF48_002111 [Arthrobacter stackebrandtii]|uniref:DUF1795 domain-containing protein n=1 Tax=Arthrobacter stackebrandtii TaxID=272161 RepID=A0ABS4YWZ8_9MICC|nr:hypothetical protein [Arthrobacter stackebrandtii]MBP2413312.1 hypothetical protein [Arthrobacter stackebrandtii]PYG99594.1 hypothetical protein CVV67_14775 [Arthrobacter stackebrandtii]
MSTKFTTDLGFEITLPDGAAPVEESSAGPQSRQFSLADASIVSVVRDDAAAASLADAIGWTEQMAEHYVASFGAAEEMQGAIQSPGKQAFAYSVAFSDNEKWPRRATLIGTLLDGGAFIGITLLTTNLGQPLDVQLVQSLVDGLAVTE